MFCIIDKQAMGNDYTNTVKISWLSQMHLYLSSILLVKTTKPWFFQPFLCYFDQIYKKMFDLLPYRLLLASYIGLPIQIDPLYRLQTFI